MSKVREQLAATLINHVFVVEQSLSTGRRSRKPTSPRYIEVSKLDLSNQSAVNEVMRSFIAFSSKNFIENSRYLVEKAVSKNNKLKVSWSPKILVRGLGGKIIAEGLDFALAGSIITAMIFSRQSPELSSAMELVGAITPNGHGGTSVDLLIPAFKISPFCNLKREFADFNKLFAAKLLIMCSLSFIAQELTDDQRKDIIAGQSSIHVETKDVGGLTQPHLITIEETDVTRTQRLARERLEELRRRRTMLINSITIGNNDLTYDVSPTSAQDEHQQLSINTNSFSGW